jgi:hypothetical protein
VPNGWEQYYSGNLTLSSGSPHDSCKAANLKMLAKFRLDSPGNVI